MMTNSRSSKLVQIKAVLIKPMAFILVALFTASPVVQTLAQEEIIKQHQVQPAPLPDPIADSLKTQSQFHQGPFMVVEKMPEFPGGEKARLKYLQDNIIYPIEAKEKGIQGSVYVTFFVEKDGSITDVKILRGIGGGCDEEAVRVIENMPNWIPGKQRGKAIGVQFNMPIRFPLESKNLKEKKKK